MGTDSIQVTSVIPATPERVYAAWLDSEMHGAMSGGDAEVDPRVGGDHSAWGGYISGKTLELEPHRRIVQSWFAEDFPPGSAHSKIILTFEAEGKSTRLTIDHTDIPAGMGGNYEAGWQDHYFLPMMAYFETGGAEGSAEQTAHTSAKKTPKKKPAPPKKKAAAKKSAPKKPAKKSAPKKPAKKSAAKKPAKKSAAKKATPKRAPARKAAPKKTAKKKR